MYVRVFARIVLYGHCHSPLTLAQFLCDFHSIHSLRLKSLYKQCVLIYIPYSDRATDVHFLSCLKASLSHLFPDFAIIMSLLIGYFIVIVW